MELRYQDIPTGWAICFLSGCARQEECLRHKAGLAVPETVLTAPAVTPQAMKGGTCQLFKKAEIVHTALGFGNIFKEVKQRHAAAMRAELVKYLGGNGTYYRYQHGERTLMPEQQEWIRRLFRRYGYIEEVEFDAYCDKFRFYDK